MATKKYTSKPNTYAAQILFAQAKAHLDEILELIANYNDIVDGIEALGYMGVMDDGTKRGMNEPVTRLSLTGNGTVDVWDSDILDSYWEMGPRNAPDPKVQRVNVTSMERKRLGSECGWVCIYCKKQGEELSGPDGRVWHVDHSYPVSRGGDNASDNRVLACATCNLQKHAMTAMEYFAESR